MSERPNKQPDVAGQVESPLDLLIGVELSRRVQAPDLTRAVMGRLGYMRVTEGVLRARQRSKWMRRVATAACLSLALFAGLLMHRQTADSRHPRGPTIPAALRDSFESSGAQFERAIESIRLLDILHEQGSEFLDRYDASPQPVIERPHRPELQRGNQQPFRWVRGMSHDCSPVA